MRPIDADALDNMGYELHRTYQKNASTMVYEVKKIGEIPTIEAKPNSCKYWDSESRFCALRRPQAEPAQCWGCNCPKMELITEPVRRGQWKQTKAYPNIIFCDECGEPFEKNNSSNKWNYCPNCGAEMKEE